MDTTKEYIKMCDCEEIQRERAIFPMGSDIFSVGVGGLTALGCSPTGDFGYKDINGKFIWLPRQDQMQDMIIKETEVINWRNLQNCFFDWVIDSEEHRMNDYESMEQMYLGYYMKIKHNKVWNGEKWTNKK